MVNFWKPDKEQWAVMLLVGGVIAFFNIPNATVSSPAGFVGYILGGAISSQIWIYPIVAVSRGIYKNKLKEGVSTD